MPSCQRANGLGRSSGGVNRVSFGTLTSVTSSSIARRKLLNVPMRYWIDASPGELNGLIGAAGGRGGASQQPGAGGGGSLQSGSEGITRRLLSRLRRACRFRGSFDRCRDE